MREHGEYRPSPVGPTERYVEGSSYGALCMDPAQLRAAAERVAFVLPDVLRHAGTSFIAVTGSSGVSFAFAVRMLIDVDIVIVRKPGENSHGASDGVNCTGRNSCELRKYVILDDLVASGSTIARVNRQLSPAECAGVFLYSRAHDPSRVLRKSRHKAPHWTYE